MRVINLLLQIELPDQCDLENGPSSFMTTLPHPIFGNPFEIEVENGERVGTTYMKNGCRLEDYCQFIEVLLNERVGTFWAVVDGELILDGDAYNSLSVVEQDSELKLETGCLVLKCHSINFISNPQNMIGTEK